MGKFKIAKEQPIIALTNFRYKIECDYGVFGTFPHIDNQKLNSTIVEVVESNKGLNMRFVVLAKEPIIKWICALKDAIKITVKHFEEVNEEQQEVYRKEYDNIEWEIKSESSGNDFLYLDVFIKCDLDLITIDK